VTFDRLGPRRLADRGRAPRPGAQRIPQQAPDRTGLYIGMGVGGVVIVIALAVALSSSSSSGSTGSGRGDRSTDLNLKEEMEQAQRLTDVRKLEEALAILNGALTNPAYRNSPLLPKTRAQAELVRKQIAFEKEAAEAIDVFDKKVAASKDNQTAMKNADEFYREATDLIARYGASAKIGIVQRWRQDLERWRGTNAQDDWQKDYNYTRERIKNQHLAPGDFCAAARNWRQFAERYDSPDLKAKVNSELIAIDKASAAAATKLVETAGTGAKARALLEEAQPRFDGTEGQKVLAQKLKTLQ
jgi:hypothetical protein